MKVAVIGSRSLSPEIGAYLPDGVTAILSGGAAGVDTAAERYALAHGIPFEKFAPDYSLHGRRAPLVRNTQMVDAADMVVAIWDHQSTGTAFTVRYARRQGKPVRVYILKP